MPIVFEAHASAQNQSHWIDLYHHQLSASGAPGNARLTRWIDAGVSDVVTLQRGDEHSSSLPHRLNQANIQWHHFPLSGKRLASPTDPISLQRLITWTHALSQWPDAAKVVVHCSAGLHRTGLALYLMLRGAGHSAKEAVEHIHTARALTAYELLRSPRRGERLVDTAERHLQMFLAED